MLSFAADEQGGGSLVMPNLSQQHFRGLISLRQAAGARACRRLRFIGLGGEPQEHQDRSQDAACEAVVHTVVLVTNPNSWGQPGAVRQHSGAT
jgi:hypothetical protein